MKNRKIISIIIIITIITITLYSCNHSQENKTTLTTNTPIPESEMVHIIFSLEWIQNNDVESDPYIAKITFPVSWLTDAPPLLDDDIPVELNVPELLLDGHNESENPDLITVTFPNKYFKGLPVNTGIPSDPSSPQIVCSPQINAYTMPGSNPPPEEIKISAVSGPILWSLSNENSWITLSKNHGIATDKEETITVMIDTTGFSLGNYNTNLLLTDEDNGETREIPVKLFITTDQAGQIPEVSFMNGFGEEIVEGIIFEEAVAEIDILSKSGNSVIKNFDYYNVGDLCLVISGSLRNITKQDALVYLRAIGYDSNGDEVASTFGIEVGPLSGIVNIDIPQQSTIDFKLTLNWAENIKVIKLEVNQY